jgi:hypothetical protein
MKRFFYDEEYSHFYFRHIVYTSIMKYPSWQLSCVVMVQAMLGVDIKTNGMISGLPMLAR